MKNRAKKESRHLEVHHYKPLTLVAILTALIVVAGVVVMFLLSHLPPFSGTVAMMIHSFLLLAILAPAICLLIYRPMAERIAELKAKDKELGEMSHSIEEVKTKFVERDLILEASSECIIRVDTEGTIYTINTFGARMFGYKNDELEGENISMILPDDTPQALLHGYESFLDGWDEERDGAPNVMEAMAMAKNGHRLPVEISISDCMIDSKTYYVVFIRDVTQRNKAEEELRESQKSLSTIFEESIDGILLADPETKKFKMGNQKICDMLGYTMEEMMELGVDDFHPEDELPYVLEQFDRQMRGEIKLASNLPVKRKDGSIFYADINSVPINRGGVECLMGTFRDVTERREAEEALKENEARFRGIFDNSNDAIFIVDPACDKIVNVNMKACDMLGYSTEELLSTSMSAIHPDEMEKLEEFVSNVFKTGSGVTYGLSCRTKLGECIPAGISASVVEIEGKSLMIAMVRDFSEKKKAEDELRQNEARFRTLFESTSAAVMLLDKKGFFDCNKATWQMFACDGREDFLHRHPGELSPPNQPGGRSSIEYANEKMAEAFEKGGLRFEWTHRRKNGEDFPADVLLTALEIDGHDILQAIIIDISIQKKGERELLIAKEIAEDATKLKDKFVSLVAHDLKSPFTSILGTMNLLSNDSGLNLSENQRKLMDSVLRGGDRMVRMIDEILDLTRLRTGQIELKPTFLDGHALAHAAVGAIGFKASEKGITIVNDVPAGSRLYADATFFSEVIFNLVSNAIKFCGKGDVITLFIPDGRPTTIAVRDTGSGIGEKMLQNIFSSEAKTTTVGSMGEMGTGLGLPYSYEIMQAHGGELTVQTMMGEGSIFYATLPHIKPQIMIVDDEQAVREMLTLFLADLAVDIVEVNNGEEALEAIEDRFPHLIISNINMPVMDGFALLREIKRDARMKEIPVIVITSDGKIETREKVLRLGADDFVEKPVKMEEFIPRIRKHIM